VEEVEGSNDKRRELSSWLQMVVKEGRAENRIRAQPKTVYRLSSGYTDWEETLVRSVE
jgi:hypothetical protein